MASVASKSSSEAVLEPVLRGAPTLAIATVSGADASPAARDAGGEEGWRALALRLGTPERCDGAAVECV